MNAKAKKTIEEKADSGKVLSLNTPEVSAKGSPQKKRRSYGLLLSFILCFVLPIAGVAVYYYEYATDRFAAKAGFSIRGVDSGVPMDGIGAITGLASSGSTTSDSYIVLSYLKSRALVEELDRSLDLRAVYSDPSIDILARLSPDASIEEFVDYWEWRIKSNFDPTSGIIEFEVQSFDAAHAREVTEEMLLLLQALVNELTEAARQDALRFAREEVVLQEARLRDIINKIREFRTTEQSVDPSASAALEIQLLASLEARLIDINARISAQSETLDANAPSLVALRRTAEALQQQISERRDTIGGDLANSGSAPGTTSERLAKYEALEVDRTLAQQAYASALNSLEQARRDADRQQRYLAIHMRPQTPQEAAYPKRARDVSLISFILFAFWAIGSLITYSVRDHLT